MKGLVYAVNLFQQAIASAIALACAAVVTDPYLIWPYVALAVANFVSLKRFDFVLSEWLLTSPPLLPRSHHSQILVFVFPTYFRHLNDPVEFNDRDRMEGKQDDLTSAPKDVKQ